MALPIALINIGIAVTLFAFLFLIVSRINQLVIVRPSEISLNGLLRWRVQNAIFIDKPSLFIAAPEIIGDV